MDEEKFAAKCSEKTKKKKKRVWSKQWLGRPGQHGLSLLQKELEMHDKSGFREMLRMTCEEFEFILSLVEDKVRKQHTKMRRAITPRERVSLTLRFLATGETFASLSCQYKLGTTTVSRIVMETCDALYQAMNQDFLKPPTTEAEWRAVARDFDLKWQFPHCLGAVEAMQIQGKSPAAMLAVVDANYKFLCASVGTERCESDAGLFAQSDLCRVMDRGLLNFPPPEPLPNTDVEMPYMLAGDGGFPLRSDLMKPYPCSQMDHGRLVFNRRLFRARRVAENAFGILANRLRVFRSPINLVPGKIVKLAMASLCIHNYLLERGSEAYVPPAFADWEDAEHHLVDGAWRQDGMGAFQPVDKGRERNPAQRAQAWRDHLRDYFVSPVGRVPWQEAQVEQS